MSKSTKTDLVNEIRRFDATMLERKDIKELIADLERGDYTDMSTKYGIPKMQLALDLRRTGFFGLATRVENHEFDETVESDEISEEDRQIVADLESKGKVRSVADVPPSEDSGDAANG